MKANSLLTAAAHRHIMQLLRALRPLSGRLERFFRADLRKARYDVAHTRAILELTSVSAGRCRSLAQFFEGVSYHGRRLARLNMKLDTLIELLAGFGRAVDEALAGTHAPAREQLHTATIHALQIAWYDVRESEAQTFYGLAHAEAVCADLDELLVRIVRIVSRTFRAAAGRIVLTESPLAAPWNRELYRVQPIDGWEAYESYWSFPVGRSGLLQLGFSKPYPWLPRERTMMLAAAERCAAAIERARLNEEMTRLETEARRAEEEERRRIGRELHDDTAQSLLLLRLQLEMMEREAPEIWRGRLGQSREIAERAIEDLRRTIAALSPALLERLGLESALRQLAARFEKRHPAQVQVSLSQLRCELAAASEEVIYRVAQECLQNIFKHSSANRVFLRLRRADKSVRLSVSDNGTGFNPELALGKRLSFGLAGMRDRASLLGGKLAVRSIPGNGATVTLDLPITSTAGAIDV